MKPNKTISAAIVILCTVFGGLIGFGLSNDRWYSAATCVVGLALGLISIRVIRLWLHTGIRRLVGGACGLAAGAILAILVNWGIPPDSFPPPAKAAIHGLILTLFGLVGMQLGYSRGPELRRKTEEVSPEEKKVLGILDTSVIIDGRIADVCETGFVDGDLIIPQFILKELQMIADSSEATRRTRGRRGLDILNKMQKQSFVKIIIEDVDFPSVKEVDQKLITLAKETGRAILTNDFNLNKVAEVHSIQVLNINQLANALKPVVLPGETMKAQIIKEGKEPSQGVAYLDDGTMVVIDHGKRFMGKTIEVTVTSVLQTTAGRMIFATIKS